MTDMPLYQGTKTLRAKPMTKQEYCAYRDWTVPADEIPGEAGYLVEYTDGGKPNHADHVGYISWSPADVFEQTYHPAASFVDRMRIELRELSEKRTKLSAFINSQKFRQVPEADQLLMENQRNAMELYEKVLAVRLKRASDAAEDDCA